MPHRGGLFVAALARPDKSVRIWWRNPIDEAARGEPALEVFLPETATLTELHPSVLAPGILPNLWIGESITVTDAVAYFARGRTVMVQREEGYEEPVLIPACPQAAVEAAITKAVQQGILWLLNGPASFQAEGVPAGVLTAGAQLRAPMSPMPVDRLSQSAVPDAWKDGETTALALSIALAAENNGRPIPWSIMRQAIHAAIASRWLVLAPGSAPWPSDVSGAASVTLKQPTGIEEPRTGPYAPRPPGVYHASATLDPSAFQDLVEILPDLIKITAGVPLKFSLSLTLGDGQELAVATVERANQLLEQVNAELRLT